MLVGYSFNPHIPLNLPPYLLIIQTLLSIQTSIIFTCVYWSAGVITARRCGGSMGVCRCPCVDMGGRPMMCGRVMMGVMMCWVGGSIALVILCMWRCVVWSTLKERNYIINLISYTTVTKIHSFHNKKRWNNPESSLFSETRDVYTKIRSWWNMYLVLEKIKCWYIILPI